MLQLPSDFIQLLSENFPHEKDQIIDAYQSVAPTSIRLNPSKLVPISDQLSPINWEPLGFFLEERPLFTADPLFHAGAYYVQEASSMFIGQIIRQLHQEKPISRILDLCAAPGGKTTHIASVLPKSSLIVANEVHKKRAGILKENIVRWGASNVLITSNQAEDFERLSDFFDVICVDAPCSGEGMFRKDPDSIKEWSLGQVELCSARQKDILESAWKALKPNGYLVYSTCTLNKQENEDVILPFADLHKAELIPPTFNTEQLIQLDKTPIFRCIPGLSKGEGFSFAILKKIEPENHDSSFRIKSGNQLIPLSQQLFSQIESYSTEELKWFQFKDFVLTIPKSIYADAMSLLKTMSVLKLGTDFGTVKENEIKLSHDWINSDFYQSSHFDEIELNLEQSISYLQRNIVPNSSYSDLNQVVFTFNSIPLGMGKNAGNRFNNLFPMDLRIRMSISKERYFSIAKQHD